MVVIISYDVDAVLTETEETSKAESSMRLAHLREAAKTLRVKIAHAKKSLAESALAKAQVGGHVHRNVCRVFRCAASGATGGGNTLAEVGPSSLVITPNRMAPHSLSPRSIQALYAFAFAVCVFSRGVSKPLEALRKVQGEGLLCKQQVPKMDAAKVLCRVWSLVSTGPQEAPRQGQAQTPPQGFDQQVPGLQTQRLLPRPLREVDEAELCCSLHGR